MSMKIGKPINKVQERFNELCDNGGGAGGGPARTKIQELLHQGSEKLNEFAFDEITSHLAKFSDRNPWHVCYAVSLGWGHLARIEEDFTDAATIALETRDPDALREASTFHLERGRQPILDSLTSGHQMFSMVRLPQELPDDLSAMARAQTRWMTPLVSPSQPRPRYMGTWNATAMFMVALFAKPVVATNLRDPGSVALPPNGPIASSLSLLHKAKILTRGPAGNDLDGGGWEPGVIYENNGLMLELLKGKSDWNLLDVHSGLYMLGTRFPLSAGWVS